MESKKLMDYLRRVTQDTATVEESRLSERWFTRKRKMSFTDAICFIFDLRKTSLQTRLNSFFGVIKRGVSMTQQAFSKLRSKFNHKPFERMLNVIVSQEYSGQYPLTTWRGLHILAVDGSYLQLPNTAQIRELYGTRGEGRQCACAGISVLYDVLSGWVLNPIITHSNMNEREECANHLRFLHENLAHIVPNSLIILDRGYPSRDLLKAMEEIKLKYLVRCGAAFVSVVNAAGVGSTIVTLDNGLSVRVYKFALPGGETETLLTNLLEHTDEDLVQLYGKRWGIETLYAKLKNIVCVENFSGRTPNAVLQDFWASMVLINTIAVFQKEADEAVTEKFKYTHRKHAYRAKTSDLVVTLRDKFIFACLRRNRTIGNIQMRNIITILASSVSPIRPDRSFPRRFPRKKSFNLFLKSHL